MDLKESKWQKQKLYKVLLGKFNNFELVRMIKFDHMLQKNACFTKINDLFGGLYWSTDDIAMDHN